MTPVRGAESTLRARDLLTCVDDDKGWALVEDIIEGLGICAVVVEMLSSISSTGAPGASATRCYCYRASNGQLASEEPDRRSSVAGCRIGEMPFVVGVEGGHRDRPQ